MFAAGHCGSTVATAATSCGTKFVSQDRSEVIWLLTLALRVALPFASMYAVATTSTAANLLSSCPAVRDTVHVCHGKLWQCEATESYRHETLSVLRHATDGCHTAVLCAPLQGLLQAPRPLPSTTACPSAPDSGTASAGRALTCTWQQGAVCDCD